MGILTFVFMVIPFLDEASVAVFGGVNVISKSAFIIDAAGNAAISSAEIAKDPKSAPFAILGLLVGAGGIVAKGLRKASQEAAEARTALSADNIKLFGAEDYWEVRYIVKW